MSAVSYVESSIVLLNRRGELALTALDQWIESAGIEVVPFTSTQARLARQAFVRYGKGRHPAALNFGDCISYALASDRGDELLFRGLDFAKTDVQRYDLGLDSP
jgi:ribonuclease VapC